MPWLYTNIGTRHQIYIIVLLVNDSPVIFAIQIELPMTTGKPASHGGGICTIVKLRIGVALVSSQLHIFIVLMVHPIQYSSESTDLHWPNVICMSSEPIVKTQPSETGG